MWLWWFMLGYDLLIPVVMIIAGRMMWKHPPQDINRIYGYRTSRSMKNMETWKFAHDHCGRLWWKTGWIMIVPTIAAHIPFYGKSQSAISIFGIVVMCIQVTILIASIFPTEKALTRTFNLQS